MTTNITESAPDDAKEDDGRLDVGDLVRMFEESEEATLDARALSERDRDYYDNIQHTAEEIATLEKRGQPIVTDNRIKSKIDFLVGLEKQQRIDPKALPRTPQHEDDADGATQALRYVTETEDYDSKRSAVWRNMLIEGSGGISVSVEPESYGAGGEPELCIKLRNIAWDRMFADPHSSDSDFEDAGYKGIVIWKDYNDALIDYKDNEDVKDILDTTMASVSMSDTYDDKPKFNLWADKKRKRIRIVQIWIKRDDEWHFAEFTKGGILKSGLSPYKTDRGESDCELILQSAYVNRENERYGLVRELVSPQDEVNKRRSKTLHSLSTAQVLYEESSLSTINTIEEVRKQIARPDGTVALTPGALEKGAFVVNKNTEMAEGHFKLLQEAQNSIDLKGPNATMLGDKTQGSSAASGKAIIASQQGGMISLGDLMDNLRHLDKRVFRAIWNRIRQFWTGQKWIRITDDERNIKWVGMNVDPQQVQMYAQQNPEMAQKIAGVVGNVAELDCDIIIDEQPDNLTPQLEQFQALVELKKMDAQGEIPFRALVEAVPNLKNRSKFLELMEQQEQQRAQQPPPPPPEIVKAQIDGQVAQQKAQTDAQLQVQKQASDAELAHQKLQVDSLLEEKKQNSAAQLAAQKHQDEMALKAAEFEHEADLEERKAQHQAKLAAHQAEQDAALAAHKTEQEAKLAERRTEQEGRLKEKTAAHDASIADRKAKSEEKHKAEAAKDKEKEKPKPASNDGGGSSKTDAALVAAIVGMTHVIENANKPRTIKKGQDGSYRSEIG